MNLCMQDYKSLCAAAMICVMLVNAVVTCEIKLFQNYFSLRRCQTEIVLFECAETCLKLFQNYFRSILQLMNIF